MHREPNHTRPIHGHSILSSRVLSRLSTNDPQILDPLADAPVIVGLQKIRDQTNKLPLRRAVKKARRRVFNYHSVGPLRGQDLTEAAQQSVWNVASSVSKDALGILPLLHGMRVMITENVAIRNRLVNGMEGIVKHITYDTDESNRRYAKAYYVLVEGSSIQLEGLNPTLFRYSLFSNHSPSKVNTANRFSSPVFNSACTCLLPHRLQKSG